MSERDLSTNLEIRRVIMAPPARVFRAWTDPVEVKKWWGPKGITCVSAEIEPIVGSRYRIENRLPDGSLLGIRGEFLIVDEPSFISYTWIVGDDTSDSEKVSVRFEPRESGTEIILTHSKFSTTKLRDQHEHGWAGCIDGLTRYLRVIGASQ